MVVALEKSPGMPFLLACGGLRRCLLDSKGSSLCLDPQGINCVYVYKAQELLLRRGSELDDEV